MEEYKPRVAPMSAGAVLLDFSKGYSATQTVKHILNGCGMECSVIESLADMIESQTKPARIPEPGLWGVVKARKAGENRLVWVHVGPVGWTAVGSSTHTVAWDSLIDPTLVREGLS